MQQSVARRVICLVHTKHSWFYVLLVNWAVCLWAWANYCRVVATTMDPGTLYGPGSMGLFSNLCLVPSYHQGPTRGADTKQSVLRRP